MKLTTALDGYWVVKARDFSPNPVREYQLTFKRLVDSYLMVWREHINVHRFRHTFAINFLRNGGNLLELQRLLGHERLDTLHIYVQLAQSDLRAAQTVASPADNWRL